MHSRKFFEKLEKIKSDEQQCSAYDTTESTVVLAGPGSGKTTILALKAVKLLSNELKKPQKLACLTYNRDAANEIKRRLRDFEIQDKACFVGTLHSFCISEILIPFCRLYPQYNVPFPIKIVPKADKIRIFNKAKDSIQAFNLRVEDMDKERTRSIDGLSSVVLDCYDAALRTAVIYEKMLYAEGFIDYITIVNESCRMIHNEEYIQIVLDAKFPWIFVDEYQDLGKPLHEMILSLLAMTSCKIFAVGDPDQSIYDFQGASPDYLKELCENEHVKKNIRLLNNYRSAPGIIKASQMVLKEPREYKASGYYKDFSAKFEFYVCEKGMEAQYAQAALLVLDLIEEGVEINEICLLVGSNDELNDLASFFEKKNIPCFKSKFDFSRTNFISWLEDCVSWIFNPRGSSFDNLFKWYEKLLLECNKIIVFEDKIYYKRLLYDFLAEIKDNEINFLVFLEELMVCLGLHDIFRNSMRYSDEIENTEKFKEFISKNDKIIQLNNFKSIFHPEDKVILSTRHSVKGLEFDVVMMLGMEKDSFPHYYCNTPQKMNESRRLCFVCISRARKKCILLRSRFLFKGGQYRGRVPSVFWEELYTEFLN